MCHYLENCYVQVPKEVLHFKLNWKSVHAKADWVEIPALYGRRAFSEQFYAKLQLKSIYTAVNAYLCS